MMESQLILSERQQRENHVKKKTEPLFTGKLPSQQDNVKM
jgi:hypothetical protein